MVTIPLGVLFKVYKQCRGNPKLTDSQQSHPNHENAAYSFLVENINFTLLSWQLPFFIFFLEKNQLPSTAFLPKDNNGVIYAVGPHGVCFRDHKPSFLSAVIH